MSGIDPAVIISLGGASAVASGVTVALTLLKEWRKRRNPEDDENRDTEIELTVTDKDGSITYTIEDEVERKLLELFLEEVRARKESESQDSGEQQEEHEEHEEVEENID
jgi:hypothetical protein